MSYAFETLEAYSSNAQNSPPPFYITNYPPDNLIKMSNINLNTTNGYLSPFSWTPVNNQTGFGQNTVVVSNNNQGSGEVDLYFHTIMPTFTINFQGQSGLVAFNVTPNIPSPTTGVLNWKDLNTGQTGGSANSPYGQTNSFTPQHTYQFYFVEYGTGMPSSATSETQTYTIPF